MTRRSGPKAASRNPEAHRKFEFHGTAGARQATHLRLVTDDDGHVDDYVASRLAWFEFNTLNEDGLLGTAELGSRIGRTTAQAAEGIMRRQESLQRSKSELRFLLATAIDDLNDGRDYVEICGRLIDGVRRICRDGV